MSERKIRLSPDDQERLIQLTARAQADGRSLDEQSHHDWIEAKDVNAVFRFPRHGWPPIFYDEEGYESWDTMTIPHIKCHLDATEQPPSDQSTYLPGLRKAPPLFDQMLTGKGGRTILGNVAIIESVFAWPLHFDLDSLQRCFVTLQRIIASRENNTRTYQYAEGRILGLQNMWTEIERILGDFSDKEGRLPINPFSTYKNDAEDVVIYGLNQQSHSLSPLETMCFNEMARKVATISDPSGGMSLVDISRSDLFHLPPSAYDDFLISPQHTDTGASQTALAALEGLGLNRRKPITSACIAHGFAAEAIERVLSRHPTLYPSDVDYALIHELLAICDIDLADMKRILGICLDDQMAKRIAAASVVQGWHADSCGALRNITVFLQARRVCVPSTEVVNFWIEHWSTSDGHLGSEGEHGSIPSEALMLRRSHNLHDRYMAMLMAYHRGEGHDVDPSLLLFIIDHIPAQEPLVMANWVIQMASVLSRMDDETTLTESDRRTAHAEGIEADIDNTNRANSMFPNPEEVSGHLPELWSYYVNNMKLMQLPLHYICNPDPRLIQTMLDEEVEGRNHSSMRYVGRPISDEELRRISFSHLLHDGNLNVRVSTAWPPKRRIDVIYKDGYRPSEAAKFILKLVMNEWPSDDVDERIHLSSMDEEDRDELFCTTLRKEFIRLERWSGL